MRYTVQRPTIEWVEVVIENADTLEQALEMADKQFEDGDFIGIEMSWSIDYQRYWIQREDGHIFTESHAPVAKA
jgi:hypothetical protein